MTALMSHRTTHSIENRLNFLKKSSFFHSIDNRLTRSVPDMRSFWGVKVCTAGAVPATGLSTFVRSRFGLVFIAMSKYVGLRSVPEMGPEMHAKPQLLSRMGHTL